MGLPGLEPGTSSLSGTFAGCVHAARARGASSTVGWSDLGCPLGTGVVRPIWHAAGTNGGLGAGRRTPRDGAPPSAGHHHVGVQAELTRRGCTFGLTCQDAGAGRIRRAHIRGNDLEQSSQSQAAHQIKGAASSQLQRRASPVFAGHDYVGKPPSGGAAAGCPLSKLPRTSCHSARFPVQFASSLAICTGKVYSLGLSYLPPGGRHEFCAADRGPRASKRGRR